MVKLTIGGIDIKNYITNYSCKCSPVNGSNGFYDLHGNYISDRQGDEIFIDVTLEGVPTPVSVALAAALAGDSVEVDHTVPFAGHGKFYKTTYTAQCENADPGNTDYDDTDNIEWTVQISLSSAGLVSPPGGL